MLAYLLAFCVLQQQQQHMEHLRGIYWGIHWKNLQAAAPSLSPKHGEITLDQLRVEKIFFSLLNTKMP